MIWTTSTFSPNVLMALF